MGIIIWVIFGAFVGWAASEIMGASTNLLWDIVLGIVGAIIGGFIMTSLGMGGIRSFNLYGLVFSILGACVFIAIARAIR
jgi:uncharacterized membrane protein YeaQ/YmgE (transglycosylase-associated protein family)